VIPGVNHVAFRHDRLFIFQMQLARHQDMVPFDRNYIARREAELREFEAGRRGWSGWSFEGDQGLAGLAQ
jgi:hypothetical protein